MRRSPATCLLPLVLLAALAACERATPEEEAPPPPTAAPAPLPAAEEESPAPAWPRAGDDALPTVMHGRWGLVPADCEPGRDDAKGLLIIGPQRLEFYESVATLTDISESTPGRVRASFDFTGEGMSWQRDMTLAVGDDGRTLVRREFGEDAATEPLDYTKC